MAMSHLGHDTSSVYSHTTTATAVVQHQRTAATEVMTPIAPAL